MSETKKTKKQDRDYVDGGDGRYITKADADARKKETFSTRKWNVPKHNKQPIVAHTPNAPIEPAADGSQTLAEGVPQANAAEAEILVRDFDAETGAGEQNRLAPNDPDSLENEK